MKKLYSIIPKATITVEAPDATYIIEVKREYLHGKTWEFDPNSDAIGQYEAHATDKMLVCIRPVKETMQFPEDAGRRCEYLMPVEDARELYRFLRDKEPHFWFALDIAFEGELRGFDSEIVQSMRNCAGCVTDVTSA